MSGSGADGTGGNGWRLPEANQPHALPPLPWEQEPDGAQGAPSPGAEQPPAAPSSHPPRLASTPLFQPAAAQSFGAPQGAAEPQRLPPYAAPQGQQPPHGQAYGAPIHGYAPGAQGHPVSAAPGAANHAPQAYAAPSGAYGSTAAYGGQGGAAASAALPYGGAPGYGAPVAAPPGKRGFPVWAGWLIGIGVVVLIAAVLIVGYVISLLPSQSASAPADDSSGPVGGGGEQTDDDPDSDGSASGEEGAPIGAIRLDESVPTDLELGWLAAEPGGDWEVYDDSPESVVGVWDDGEHFCNVMAFSSSRFASDGATDDATATQRDLADAIEAYAEDGEESGSEQVSSFAVQFDAGAVEFLGVDVNRDLDADYRAAERWYWRSFAEAGTQMHVQLVCDQEPTAEMVEQSVGQLRMQ